jgi:hypothetical protein
MYSLAVNKADLEWNFYTLGLNEMVGHLMNSGLFKISYHDERLTMDRSYRATILVVEGKRIYVDFWEYALPTYSPQVVAANFDLIIKLQHQEMKWDDVNNFYRRKKYFVHQSDEEKKAFLAKIVPWTFFPSKMLTKFVGHEEDVKPLPIERMGFFCGKYWKCRHALIKQLESQGIECFQSDRLVRDNAISDEKYLHMMQTSQFGIVLSGRRSALTEGKNRREIDYMILRRPLALNYRPYYYDPLVEGQHYVYFDAKTNFAEVLKTLDCQKMVNEAYAWYQRNASPEGVVKSFLRILRERLDLR